MEWRADNKFHFLQDGTKRRRTNLTSNTMGWRAEESIPFPTGWNETQKNKSHFLHDGIKRRRINLISYTMGWRAEESIPFPIQWDEEQKNQSQFLHEGMKAEEVISLPTRWNEAQKNQFHFLHGGIKSWRINLISCMIVWTSEESISLLTQNLLLMSPQNRNYMRKYFSKSIRGSVGLERMLKNGQKSHDTVLLKN